MMKQGSAPVASSNAVHQSSATPTLESREQLNPDEELFPVRVRFKRVTLVLTTLVLVTIASVLMLLCGNEGILIDKFDGALKDDNARTELLNKYNSWSGSVVSLIIKPLDIYLGMVLAVSFLCFASKLSMNVARSEYHGHGLIVATAAVGYLLSNGFNAINVQLAPQPIQSVITPFDLSFSNAETAVSYDAPLAEYAGPTRLPFMRASDEAYLEEGEANLLTNTILRNAIASIELSPSMQCKADPVSATSEARRSGAVMSYGFPARSWHPLALITAFSATRSLSFAVSDNSTTSPKVSSTTSESAASASGVSGTTLPMNASQAIQLLVQGIAMTQLLLPWWETSYLDDLATDKIKKTYTPTVVTADTDTTSGAKTALMSDLLFTPSALTSNTELLTQTKQLLFNLFSKAVNVSASEVQITFSRHTTVSTGITFDSLTLDIPLRRSHLSKERYYNTADEQYAYRKNTSAAADGNFYYDLDLDTDCSRDACVASEQEYAFTREETFIEPQVHALASCVNANGNEDPMLRFQYRNETTSAFPLTVKSSVSCPSNSKLAMFTVSLGKRVQGDAMDIRELKDRATDNPRVLRLTNARKVYSITITRVSWEPQDLQSQYKAQCLNSNALTASDPKANPCLGLWYALNLLQSRSKVAKQQHLVVSVVRLPLALLSSYQPESANMVDIIASTRLTPLVTKIVRQPSDGVSTSVGQSGSDLVYPRRFTKPKWPVEVDADTTKCSSRAEDLIQHAEINHLYMEQTLQPAIAAGFFFLFQDAVAQEVVSTSYPNNPGSVEALVLDFAGNVQWIDVTLSSPLANILMTLAGAGILLLMSLAIAICGGRKKERELQSLMTAHSIAELQINEAKYPSRLLEKTFKPMASFTEAEEEILSAPRLRMGFKSKATATGLGKFHIQSLILEHKDGRRELVEIPGADGHFEAEPSNGSVFA